MALDSLIDKIVNSSTFRENYEKLLLHSVRSQFQSLNFDESDMSINWEYLISCASLLSKSCNGKVLDMTYRICQAVLCENDLPNEYNSACAAILNKLTNSAAIRLAIERNFVSANYIEDVPIDFAIDVKKKQFYNSISDGDKIIYLNDFQKEVYDSFGVSKTLSISAPTSAGKSFILMQLIKELIEVNHLAKVAYIIPTRALIQQVELDVRNLLKNNNIVADVSSIPIKPEHWDSMPCIMVFTQERLQWLINENQDLYFDLVIIDEAQKIGDGARGVLLQQVVQQIACNPNTRFLFASPMSENPEALIKIIDHSDNITNCGKQVISDIPTVNQNLIWVCKSGTGTSEWDLKLFSDGNAFELGHISTNRITQISARLPVLSFALSSEKGNLIYCNGAADAEKVAIQISSLVRARNPDLCVSQKVQELIKLVKKVVHQNYVLAEVLKSGVAFHYGNMPLGIRNEIEDLFKMGHITFLVCTSTLVEGVNLPAKSIFMRGPQKGKNIPMSEMDFWNLAGRAGRQGKEFQGNIICLDATDDSAWKSGVPTERKKYHIKTTVDEVVEGSAMELISHIERTNETENADPRLDYAYTYFLTNYFAYNRIANSPLANLYGKDFCVRIDNTIEKTLEHIDLPPEILSKNQGVNPISQQRLLDYFKGYEKDIKELIPPVPEDDDAQDKYMHIIGRISKYITGDPYQLNYSRSILVTNWMRGYGLARIISDNIKWNEKQNTKKSLATIIRDTMREIEEYARFRFLKYTTCYLDVLRFYLETSQKSDLLESIPKLSLWLEFGASQTTQISLMSMGLTRMTALEIAELMVDTNMTKEQCIKWFKENDVHSMDISPTMLAEIDKILELQ